MKYNKNLIFSTLLLGTTFLTTPVFAEENNSNMAANVEAMFDETRNEFSNMKSKYNELSNNFGEVPTVNNDKVYDDYLNQLNAISSEMGIDKKMEAIKSMDLTINDPALASNYKNIRDKVSGALNNNNININVPTSKHNQQIADKNEKAKQQMLESVEASKLYGNIVDSYKNTITNNTVNDLSITNPFATDELKELSSNIESNNLNKSIVTGEKINTNQVFDTINVKKQNK